MNIYVNIFWFVCVVLFCIFIFFFFKQKTAYEMRISDWSSDVCSSDLGAAMTKRESYASPGTAMRRNGAGDVRWRRVQAACEMRGNSTTLSRAGFCSARACSSISAAVSTQLPQQIGRAHV